MYHTTCSDSEQNVREKILYFLFIFSIIIFSYYLSVTTKNIVLYYRESNTNKEISKNTESPL